MEELAMHPTVKPTALVADAIRDCSRRGEVVLDVFAGSGTTIIAAELTGRVAYPLEYDPAYCDTIISRWQNFTGKPATLDGADRTFEMIAQDRRRPDQDAAAAAGKPSLAKQRSRRRA